MARDPAQTARPATARAARQDDAILEAAWAYYHEGLTQRDIANRLGVSRASVVNYLAEARRRDYVRISLDTELFRGHTLVQELKDRFGLTEVLVVPAVAGDAPRTAERVIRVASDWLPTLLAPGDLLGVAWGETMRHLASVVPRVPLPDLTVLQLVGSKTRDLGSAAETCAVTLAQRFGAKCVNLHAPVLLSSPELAAQLRAEPSIARHLAMIDSCQKVIFASGTFGPGSHIHRTGLLDPDVVADMRERRAAGVICGRVIDAAGQPLPAPNAAQMIGITLDQMRAKTLALMVSAGPDRVAATLAALRGGYATHLATSSDIAESVLAIAAR